MKRFLKAFLYLLIIILAIQVVKKIIEKLAFPASYAIEIIIGSIQVLIILGFVLVPLFYIMCSRVTVHKRRAQAAAVFLFLLTIALCEGICTWWLYHPRQIPSFLRYTYRVYYDLHVRKVVQAHSKSSEYNSRLFYTLKPNTHFTFDNVEFSASFSTNSKGLRDDEGSLVQPSIICLGDSYGMGWGVQQDSSYCSLLQQYNGKKVLNAGVSSYGTAREITSLAQLDTSALSYLIVQYCNNDYVENREYLRNNGVLPVSSKKVYDKSVTSHMLVTRYYPGKHFLNLLTIGVRLTLEDQVPFFEAPKYVLSGQDKIIQNEAFLDVLAKAPVNFSKTKLILFRLDPFTFMHNGFETVTDSLVHTAKYRQVFGDNIRVLNTSELFTAEDYYTLDPHLNSRGHYKMANLLQKAMQSF